MISDFTKREVMKKHLTENCPNAVVVCDRCDVSLKRNAIVNHDYTEGMVV